MMNPGTSEDKGKWSTRSQMYSFILEGELRYPRGDNIKTPARSRCLVLNLEQLENWLWDYLSNMLILGSQCLGTAGN